MDKTKIKNENPELYKVAIERGTEAPFSGKFLNEKSDGTYACAVCDNPLFSSDNKFDSGTGWPSFDKPISKDSIQYREDSTFGMNRMEVMCKKCGAHLGHVFDDGPKETTGKRYCINSVCLDLNKFK